MCCRLYWKKYIKPTLLALAILLMSLQSMAAVNIAVLKSDNLKSTNRSLQGAKKIIKKQHNDAVFHIFNINMGPEFNLQIVDSIKAVNPTLILTIGSSATRLAKDNFTRTPIVFCAVKYPVLSGFVNSLTHPGGNITGASLNIPIKIQINTFKEIIPDMKKLGVLYTSNTQTIIEEAKRELKKHGVELVPALVEQNKDLPKALDSLAMVVDGMWSVADPNLFTSKSTKFILLNSLRKGIPFMGFSRNVVESGALFALDFDYKAVGFQAGEIANRILAGEMPDAISVTSADVLWFHYNENTAKRINIVMPDGLVAIAKEVYR